MLGRIPNIFLDFDFQKDRLKMWEQWGVEFLAFPLTCDKIELNVFVFWQNF